MSSASLLSLLSPYREIVVTTSMGALTDQPPVKVVVIMTAQATTPVALLGLVLPRVPIVIIPPGIVTMDSLVSGLQRRAHGPPLYMHTGTTCLGTDAGFNSWGSDVVPTSLLRFGFHTVCCLLRLPNSNPEPAGSPSPRPLSFPRINSAINLTGGWHSHKSSSLIEKLSHNTQSVSIMYT